VFGFDLTARMSPLAGFPNNLQGRLQYVKSEKKAKRRTETGKTFEDDFVIDLKIHRTEGIHHWTSSNDQ
jgi:hypothetical protein